MSLKRIELWWRTQWIRLLVRLMRRSDSTAPAWDAGPVRVLFLRHDRAGDMILSTGVMRAIARSHPAIALDVLASPANASILDGTDYVHRVIRFDKRSLMSYVPTWVALRRARYDAVIDCMVTAPSVTTLLLILASGARHRIGIAGRGNDAAFTITVPGAAASDAHMVDRLAALSRAFGIELNHDERRPVLTITSSERAWAEAHWPPHAAPRAVINVSAGTSERMWPHENYVMLMQHLRVRSPSVAMCVIASPDEASRGEAIARDGGGVSVATPSIRHAFALVATAGLVVTPDTSIAHAASAFGTPAVALYVGDKAERWGLYGISGENVINLGDSLATLDVDRVIPAVDRVLDGSSGERSDHTIDGAGVRHASLRQPR